MDTVIRVMLVEDNFEYRDVVQFALDGEPLMELIPPFATAEMALGMSWQSPGCPKPDVILLDLRLPGMSALEAIPYFRERIPDAKIVILSQSDDEDDVLQSIFLGASGYLLKSSTVSQIKEGIRNVVTGGAALDSNIAHHVVSALRMSPLKTLAGKVVTDRERDVLELLSEGLPKKIISGKLHISYATVDAHVRNIYRKLSVSNAPAAVRRAYEIGIFPA